MQRKNILKTLFVLPVLSLFISSVSAATPPEFGGLGDVLDKGVEIFFSFVFIAAAVMIVFGGYMWIISAGDPQRIKTAQGTLTWAVIGLIFFGIMRAVLQFVLDLL